MTLILSSSATYTYLIPISLILLSLVFLLWVIFRMEVGQIFNTSSVTYVKQNSLQAQIMMPINNPFVVKLENGHTSSLKEGVTLKISCQVDCILQAFWGVNVHELHYFLMNNKIDLCKELINGTFMSDSFLHSQNIISLSSNSDHQYYLKAPDRISDLSIGTIPRTRYPLVLVLCVNNATEVIDSCDNDAEVRAMICLIHLKDSICKVESSILSEYLKHKNGRISSLKKLFVEGDTDQSADSSNYSQITPNCIICQSRPISHALLPCRHTCVCGCCFNQLEGRCPMCRSPITSFFSILENDENVIPEPNEVAPHTPSFFDPIDRFINNLIQWF